MIFDCGLLTQGRERCRISYWRDIGRASQPGQVTIAKKKNNGLAYAGLLRIQEKYLVQVDYGLPELVL
jgi:hypothetical protein